MIGSPEQFSAELLRAAAASGYVDPRQVLKMEPHFRAGFGFFGAGEHLERILTCHDTYYRYPECVVIGTLEHFLLVRVTEKPMFGPSTFDVSSKDWSSITSAGSITDKKLCTVHLDSRVPSMSASFPEVDPEAASQFVAFARERIDTLRVTPTGPSVIQDLERLAALRASGALTEEEFVLAKRKLLGL